MTKTFEEEAIKEAKKSGIVMNSYACEFNAPNTGLNLKSGQATHNFPWLEFARKWHSDEEFQAEKDARKKEYEIHQDIYSKTSAELNKAELEIVDLKSQLQQQALPIVKDFVAEWYEEHKDDLGFSIFEACVNLHDDNSSDFEKWFGNSENESIETLVRMKNGYTVEKPQLFYLKHIDMSKNDDQVDWYMSKAHRRVGHTACDKGKLPICDSFKFTQSEIDSMQTGSYEQIEVAE